MIPYSPTQFFSEAAVLADKIREGMLKRPYSGIYPVPNGGIALGAVLSAALGLPIVSLKDVADLTRLILVVDDLVDSGTTRKRFYERDFACLHLKRYNKAPLSVGRMPTYYVSTISEWIQYWWEKENEGGVEDNIVRILEFIGEDPNRPGLIDTPKRVAKMYQEIFRGYKESEKPEITCFPNGQDGVFYDEMLIDEGYFFSFCEHHILPFFGDYFYGYIPDQKILGASKVGRLIDYHSAKLQIAERLVNQVVTDIETVAQPLGQVLVMKARHLCKEMRGLKKPNSPFTAIAVRGYFAQNRNGCKDEFMTRISKR